MAKPDDKLLDHNYDGVQEYDNPLPRWWLGTFYLSIVFALIYGPYYILNYGPSQEQEWEVENAAGEALEAQFRFEMPSESELAAMLDDQAAKAAGQTVFVTYCVACHAPDGGGLVGPNLTDRYWLHGNKLSDVINTIYSGVPAKGMIAWGKQLKKEQILNVAVFVKSLTGTTPKNPKAQEGTLYE